MSASSSPGRVSAMGMTLLELLVVVGVLAVLAGLFPLAIERMMPARRLAATARALTLQVRELQSQAVFCGRALQLTLEPGGFCVQRSERTACTRVRWQGISATLRLDPHSQATHVLTMYPDGSSSGGELELRSGQHRAAVTVSALTGRVRYHGDRARSR